MVCKNATRSASSTDVEMGAKKNTFFSEVKEKPIQSFINSSKSASMDELQQMTQTKPTPPQQSESSTSSFSKVHIAT